MEDRLCMENQNEMPQGNGPMNDGSAMNGGSAPVPPPMPEVSAAPAPEPMPAPAAMPAQNSSSPSMAASNAPHADERRGMAAISYLGVLCLIPLIFAKDSAFAQYHAKQGLVLAIIGIVVRMLADLLWRVPFGGALTSLVYIALLVITIMGILKALKGEKFEIPMVSEWAAKIHF